MSVGESLRGGGDAGDANAYAARAAPAALHAEQPSAAYAGRSRHTLLEYEAILANAPVGIAFTRGRKFFLCNPKFAAMLGWKAEELIGKPGEFIYTGQDSYAALAEIAVPILGAGRQLDAEWQLRRKDGSTFLARLIAKSIDAARPGQGTVWIVQDIAERKLEAEQLERVLAEQRAILDAAAIGILFVKDRRIAACNPRFAEMYGCRSEELVGQPTSSLFGDAADFARLADARSAEHSYLARRRDGSVFRAELRTRTLDESDAARGEVWLCQELTPQSERELSQRERELSDRERELRAANEQLQAEIAERKQAELRTQHLADHDALTGLPNRRLLEDRLTRAIASSQRNGRQSAVMFIDLDRFKAINDAVGHAAGDLLLKEMAKRLLGQLREADTVCRIGGDEFVVVLPEIKHASDAAQVARKIIEQLSRPVPHAVRELNVTPSIGISVFPSDGEDAAALIRNADAAMYHAKENGRANYQFFTSSMNRAALERLSLETDLRAALENTELRLAYQPMVELSAGRLFGYEALVRWRKPRKGRRHPADFLPLAEESGLILALGEWSIRTACRWAANVPGIETIALNLSARQFIDPGLVRTVASALEATGLPAGRLQLELPETVLTPQIDGASRRLGELKALGVSLGVNAFGRSAINLSALKSLPLDRLKLDRELLAGVPGDPERSALLAALLGFARSLGLRATAVGVETEAQRDFLRAHGCDAAQGFLLGRPAKQPLGRPSRPVQGPAFD